ncbi:probable CCR4-associated factor 1 homolog 11 [Actinidia eriantha]|uniref:probable CCR4-associated factor 1 homolog 11 n=1 Tax=Actinidia eriantha TaxID=165200 RepID=UPI002585DDA9|nr:probable CCR4-associated factor 1 homolog 11 [Actinidia eriantha]
MVGISFNGAVAMVTNSQSTCCDGDVPWLSIIFYGYWFLSGVVFNSQTAVTGVTFHGAYDFGFLVKLLTQNDLPPNLPMFMQLVRIYFGGFVLDLKHMMKFCDGLCGGLEKLAKALNVDRVVGKSHQAGPDSLLTMQTFLRLRDT